MNWKNLVKGKWIVRMYDRFLQLMDIPWRYYSIRKCEDAGVIFEEKRSVMFNGHCWLNISPKSRVNIGKNVTISSGPRYCITTASSSKIEVQDGATLKIGGGTGMSNVSLICTNSITIGNNAGFGAGCLIIDSNFHSLDYRARRDFTQNNNDTASSPIVIEDDVFVGAQCVILKGVTIGARSVIAAGSVVVKSIPPDCIAGGNPCVVIKPLTIEE